jgi:hypothetical protein
MGARCHDSEPDSWRVLMSSSFQNDQVSSTSTSTSTSGTAAVEHDGGLGAVLRAIEAIVESTDPNVVFDSVTAVCVPIICDEASFAIRVAEPAAAASGQCESADADAAAAVGGGACVGNTTGRPRLSVVRPPDELGMRHGPVVTENSVSVAISVPATDGQPGYQGVLALGFSGYRPSSVQAVLAELIVERARSALNRARLAARLAAETSRANNLQSALASNREIGVAIGIVMLRYKLTESKAFDLLRRVSQHNHRKLRELAFEIGRTGELQLPPGFKVDEHTPLPKRHDPVIVVAGRAGDS